MFRKNFFLNSIFLITFLFTFLFLHFIEFSRHALASKESDRQSFIDGCRKGVKSDRFYPTVKRNLESYGWPNESVELHFNYQTEVIKHPLVFERYCQDLLTIAMSNDNLVQQINKEARENNGVSITSIRIGYQMITKYFSSGIKRLSFDKLAPYFDFTYSIFNQMPQKLCRQLWSGNLNQEMNNFLLSIQGHLPIETQMNYFDLVKNAIFAEVTSSPLIAPIDNIEASELNQKFGNYLTKYSLKFDDPYKLAQLLNNLVQGTDTEYCDVGRLYYGALFTMPGRDGDRMRRLFLDGI